MKRSAKTRLLYSLLLLSISVLWSSSPGAGSSHIAIAQDGQPTISSTTASANSATVYRGVQYGPVASNQYVVWMEATQPYLPSVQSLVDGSFDIVGLNLSTNQPVVITNEPGNQQLPAISGSLVVWQHSVQSCPSCAPNRDIMGKDLSTGQAYSVATGPSDQNSPAVADGTVAWVEHNTNNRLLYTELGSGQVSEIVSAPLGVSISRPAISDRFVVWVEKESSDIGSHAAPAAQLKALDRQTGAIQQIAASSGLGTWYALAGSRLVWTDPQLHVTDLATGQSQVLYSARALEPNISSDGQTVVWAAAYGTSVNIWGLKLAESNPLPLFIGSADPFWTQRVPAIAGDRLFWQNSGGPDDTRITSTSLTNAFAEAPVLFEELQRRLLEGPQIPAGYSPAVPAPPVASAAAPPWLFYAKGIFAPRSNGSNNAWRPPTGTTTKGVDALGASRNTSHFGSIVILTSDLGATTGYASGDWGPKASDAMRTFTTKQSTRVVVRTPTHKPLKATDLLPGGPTIYSNPDLDAEEVLTLIRTYHTIRGNGWFHAAQIANEPNVEWQEDCTCSWIGAKRPYKWTQGAEDPEIYNAINDWYIDVHDLIIAEAFREVLLVPDYANIMDIALFPPAMLRPSSGILPGGINQYDLMATMIQKYHRFTYHVYPSPADDPDGLGGIQNITYNDLPLWLKSQMSVSSYFEDIITEFGWNPGRMKECQVTQDDTWGTNGTPAGLCKTPDNYNHTFDLDADKFLHTATRVGSASHVHAWITNGWLDSNNGNSGTDRANGLRQDTGDPKRWFINYQNMTYHP